MSPHPPWPEEEVADYCADSGAFFWSAHGVRDSHVPECFVHIHLSDEDVSAVSHA